MEIPEDASPEQIQQAIAYNLKHARRLFLEECLFCESRFESLPQALEHMATEHSFSIPDLEFLRDLPGLMQLLGEKISVYNTCIYFGEKSRLF